VDRARRQHHLRGPIGTGKTHLAIALGVEAARQRKRVLFARAADIVRSLLEARDARELGRLQRRLHQVDLLVLDELGFVPFDRAGGGDEKLTTATLSKAARKGVGINPSGGSVSGRRSGSLSERRQHHGTVGSFASLRMTAKAQNPSSASSSACLEGSV
jgi:hypothetical protein